MDDYTLEELIKQIVLEEISKIKLEQLGDASGAVTSVKLIYEPEE